MRKACKPRKSKCIGIIGSRRRAETEDKALVLAAFLLIYRDGDTIVSGGCPCGGDRFAEQISSDYVVPIKIHRADWKRFGRRAGFERNTYVARDSNILIACVASDRTGGTEDTIRKFVKMHPRRRVIIC